MTRRLIAAAVVCGALAAPAGAVAEQDTNPATTAAPSTTATPTTSTPATTPGATTPGATTTAPGPATTPPPVATTPTPAPAQTTPAPAKPTTRPGNDRAAVILLLMVGALVLLALVLWALARWQAWEPPWLIRWRHATGEVGWRAGNAWAEFTDWLRLGR